MGRIYESGVQQCTLEHHLDVVNQPAYKARIEGLFPREPDRMESSVFWVCRNYIVAIRAHEQVPEAIVIEELGTANWVRLP